MKKIIIPLVLLFCVITAVCLGIGFSFEYKKVDMTYINEVMQNLKSGQTTTDILYDYTLVAKSGEVLSSSKEVDDMQYQTRLSKVYADGDIVIDFDDDSKIIFYLDAKANFYKMRNTLVWFMIGSCGVLLIAIVISCVLIYNRTVRPFGKLRDFAMEVARGNLDSPLVLDKYLTFGAFGEAFDIMRNNLMQARIAEQNASLERSRLLQEIGHEIKTPLSTIKAVAECGCAVQKNRNYEVIFDKANAIDNLINDFYRKALEEEGQLNVFICKHSMTEFEELVKTSDYNSRVTFGDIPTCNMLYDKNRMMQIVDNIIANSYKYADTQINVDMKIENNKLEVYFKDFGDGVAPEQLSYIMDRFYRGEKTEEKLGQGLGLNICRKLILRMGGDMECYNDDGFVVKLKLNLYE